MQRGADGDSSQVVAHSEVAVVLVDCECTSLLVGREVRESGGS